MDAQIRQVDLTPRLGLQEGDNLYFGTAIVGWLRARLAAETGKQATTFGMLGFELIRLGRLEELAGRSA